MSFINSVLNVNVAQNDQESSSFEEAVTRSNARQWIEEMNEEMNSLSVNDTLDSSFSTKWMQTNSIIVDP